RAAARPQTIAGPSTRTWVGRSHEREPRGIRHRATRPRDADASGLDGLPQRLENRGLELGHLVEEEDAQVRLGNFARERQTTATTDQSGGGDTMVRRAKGPRPAKRAVARQLPQEASQLRDLERLPELERRKDAGQAAGQHGLPRARRPAEQQVVSSGRRDLEGALRLLLPVNLRKVVLQRGGGYGRV